MSWSRNRRRLKMPARRRHHSVSPRQHSHHHCQRKLHPYCQRHPNGRDASQHRLGLGKRNDHNNNHIRKRDNHQHDRNHLKFLQWNASRYECHLYHAAMDPEGSTMVMGWDVNLDGSIDVPVSTNSGFTTINISISQWHEIPTTDSSVLVSIAFLAIDLEGDIGIAVIDFYSTTPEGPWSEPHLYPLGPYSMSGKDAQGTPGTGAADNLIMLTMDQGGDINWAAVSVKLSIDGAAPVTCDNPGVDGTSVCRTRRVWQHRRPSLVRW